jgi:hypothetical protein
MEAIVVVCPKNIHNKLERYFRGKDDDYNINKWQRQFNDEDFDVNWYLVDSDTGTAFLEVDTTCDNYKEVTETLVAKLEEAIEFVQEVHDVPIKLIYRHSGMRYEATYIDGECTSYGEYEQI